MRHRFRLLRPLIALVVLTVAGRAEEPLVLDTIPIPQRSGFYRERVSRLIRSEGECRDFAGEIAACCRLAETRNWGRAPNWQCEKNSRALLKTLLDARVDFSREYIAVVFHTEGSGSVAVTVGEPNLEKGVLTLILDRNAPPLRTADMAYRAFAIRAPRHLAERIRLPLGRGVYRVYDLQSGEEILELGEAARADR